MSVAQVNGASVELRPTKYLKARNEESDDDFWSRDNTALIVLNSPLEDAEYFRRLYDHASLVVCADGGANRLYDLMLGEHAEFEWTDALPKALPHIIHGDLDSLNHHVRRCYDELGVEISGDDDQFSTDFNKSIKKVVERLPSVQDILVTGSLGGRVDQGIRLLHDLYREQKHRHPGIRFWLFSEVSVTVLLEAGTTNISTPLSEGLIKRNIGILPLYGPASITTRGLEWDVENWSTAIGGEGLSSSNHIVADHITISSDNDVLFTVERVAKPY